MANVEQMIASVVTRFVNGARQAPWLQTQMRWLSELGRSAVLHWSPTSAMGHVCRVTPVGHPPCGMSAASPCINCRQMICLDHAFARSNGHLVCFGCVSRHLPGVRPQRAAPPPPPESSVDPAILAAAYKELGLDPSVSDDELSKAVLALRVQNHPDKFTHAVDKKRASARFKAISTAYETIQQARS